MAIIKKIMHPLSTVVYCLIGLYVLICAPMLIGYKPLVVLSGSMEPTLKVGSIIYYEKVDFSELTEGDIITYKSGDKHISHRISAIEGNKVETKGDANNAPDALKVTSSVIEGRDVEKCIPYLGYYVQAVNNNLPLVLMVSLIILISEFFLTNKKTIDIDNIEEGVEEII